MTTASFRRIPALLLALALCAPLFGCSDSPSEPTVRNTPNTGNTGGQDSGDDTDDEDTGDDGTGVYYPSGLGIASRPSSN